MGDAPTWVWVVFLGLLVVAIGIDLFAHRGDHQHTRKAAVVWSLVWVGLGLGFGGFVWYTMGAAPAQEYFGAYLIEKSLSVDNLFVFLLVFQALAIPRSEQRHVLIWGILGALVFRAIFIGLGVAVLERFDWIIYGFAAILIWAAWRIFREDPRDNDESKIVQWMMKHLPVAPLTGGKFFVREGGRLLFTPLAIAVLALETTDVMFAVDSIPAALSITRDPFIVYSSNAFAILGLRALYTVMADLVSRLTYLHYGLAFVLAFAGVKILIADAWHMPPWLSIVVIVTAMGAAVIASLVKDKRDHSVRQVEA
jgi:tellurite resistance protein TerC